MNLSATPSETHGMTQSSGVASGLHWVRGELNENLKLAGQLVERHAEHPQDAGALDKALTHLHEVRGAAVLIQAYGLALLAEEIKQTVQDLAAGVIADADPAYSAIVGASMQAMDYIDLLQNGQNDSALVLQPIVNELRLARGKSLLTEDDLFVAQFRVLGLQLDRSTDVPADADAQAEAARLHPVFASSLLAWFKDQDSAQALSRIGRITEILAEVSHERALHQLWRTAAACVEALLSRALDDSLELKRQFGRAGQLMKILAERGEAGAIRQMSDVSLRLLFYAGRSGGAGARVVALRRGLQLDTWLPAVDVVQSCRARLRGANTGLLVRVAEELRADLVEVKDSIDVALRAGASAQEFEATAQRLKRVADTLLVLGLSAESQALAQPVETLREAGASDPAAWMEFATAVLQVELSLDAALYRQLQAAPLPAGTVAEKPVIADLREGTSALLRESLVNLARVKSYVEAYIKTEDVFGLPEAARLLDEIAAGFRMLSLDRAEELTLAVQRFLQSADFPVVRESNTAAGRFADTIAAIEYYVEMRRDASPASELALDTLAAMVTRLHAPVTPVPTPEAVPVPAAVDLPFELALVDYVPPRRDLGTAQPPAAVPRAGVPAVGAPPAESASLPGPAMADAQARAAAPSAPTAVEPADVDPEIRQVFIDEAQEVLETLQRAIPRWLRQPQERDVLATIRRAFHTLKGSGRMVGAQDIGEFSWAIENMLNRCLDRTIEQSQAVLNTVRDALGLVSELIGAFRDGLAPPASWPRLAEEARRLAAGEPEADETDVVAVFSADANARLQMITRWLQELDSAVGEYVVPEPVVRAFHTLRGAALAIGARAVGELAGALERYLETLQHSQLLLPDAGRILIDECCQALGQWIARLDEPGAEPIDAHPWLDRVEAIRAGVGAAAGRTEEDRQRAEAFAFEALDLVQKFEAELLSWSKASATTGHAQSLGAILGALVAAASAAHCAPLAGVAQGMQQCLGAVGDRPPAPQFFEGMLQVVEGLYTQLDQYRDGRLEGDGAEWLALLASLDSPAAEAEAPAAPAIVDAPDPELLSIFEPEATELLESLGNSMHEWRENPGNPNHSREMQRDLHTFKGGARMCGLNALGHAAHALETTLVQHEREGLQADPAALQRIAAELDALQRWYETYTLGDAAAPAAPSLPLEPPPVVVEGVQPPAEPTQPAPTAEPETLPETVLEPVLAPVPETRPDTWPERAPIDANAPPAVQPHLEAPSPPPPVEEPVAWNPELFWKPGEAAAASEARREAVRVPVERLDAMLNQAGEISIYRSRLEENHSTLETSLGEMAQTITRVREQLRLMEVETEAQIAARGFSRGDDEHRYESQFDALEMDRYSRMQELSRALAESVSDLSSLHASLDTASSEAEGLLQQQGRINTEVQQGLMGTLMVPFSRQVQRLSRVVRQTAEQNGKKARAEFTGAESELDRNVLERMTAPLEHLLRNSVVHGIEDPAARAAAGKPAEGTVHVSLKREGSQLLIEVGDDGRGLDFEAIRAQAVKRGLIRPDAQVPDEDLARFVFAAGFSTARALTQDAGRGIGMDVVAAEVKQLGGSMDVASENGRGARFRVRLPLMLAVSQALVVQVGDELFAIPLGAVEGIARAPREAVSEMMKEGGQPLDYGGHQYQVRRLGDLVGLPAPKRIESRTVPAILMRLGDGLGASERRIAVVAERLIGNREIVTKPAGPVLGSVSGISGATILADGRVMLIVHIPALIAEETRRRLGNEAVLAPTAAPEDRRVIMVVDDSITIRRVTERLLTRKGYRVITAKDGLDAMAALQTEAPDAILLDIEMPRADGFEVAAFIRNTPRIAQLPIIMITSRSGDKHRERARNLGVNRYLIKPYQEEQLLAELGDLLLAEEEQTV